jgi:hypothetical protein
LPNGSQLPTASSFAESFCRNLPSPGRILLPSWAHNSDSFLCQILVLTPANWDLWVHLFRAELHTLSTPELWVHRAVRAGRMSISLRESRRELYIPCTMTSNNAEWEWGWFYLHNDEPSLPPTPARC